MNVLTKTLENPHGTPIALKPFGDTHPKRYSTIHMFQAHSSIDSNALTYSVSLTGSYRSLADLLTAQAFVRIYYFSQESRIPPFVSAI